MLKSAATCLAASSLPVIATAGDRSTNAPATSSGFIDDLANAARLLDRLRSVVVMQQGEIVLAEAFRGPPVDRAVNVKSVSKSVVAAPAGCAFDRSKLAGVDVTLGEVVPQLVPVQADPRVARLRVQDFLTMPIGLERQSGRNYGRWASL